MPLQFSSLLEFLAIRACPSWFPVLFWIWRKWVKNGLRVGIIQRQTFFLMSVNMHVQSTLVFESFVALEADKGLRITTIINISLKWFQNTLGDEVRGSHLMSCWSLATFLNASCWSLAPLFNISCWSLATFLNSSGWSLATLLSVTGWWHDDWSRTSEIIAIGSLVNWP